MYQSINFKKRNISTTSQSISSSALISTKNSTNINTSKTKRSEPKMEKMNFLLCLASLMAINAFLLHRTEALSLISEKCDPNKVGPDETTVKGGWQAEMFNGLSFRTCGK